MHETISVFPDGDQMCAMATDRGQNLMEAPAGFGPTISDALRALADEMEGL